MSMPSMGQAGGSGGSPTLNLMPLLLGWAIRKGQSWVLIRLTRHPRYRNGFQEDSESSDDEADDVFVRKHQHDVSEAPDNMASDDATQFFLDQLAEARRFRESPPVASFNDQTLNLTSKVDSTDNNDTTEQSECDDDSDNDINSID